jgi:hypothetical protein
MSGRWSEEQTTKFVNMYKYSENLWNVFTTEYTRNSREPFDIRKKIDNIL